MNTYQPSWWNIHDLMSTPSGSASLINRTNNPCESFNSRLNQSFPYAHPSMLAFIDIIRSISNEYVAELKEIRRSNGKRVRRSNHGPTLHALPVNYAAWKAPIAKKR
jgi:hypothetical protein